MKRNVSLDEISDGQLYGPEDMVRVGCNDCQGCSACCHGMGSSIILDPLDVFRLTKHLDCDFPALLGSGVELNVVDGIILPNMKMSGDTDQCTFLDASGRCSVHSARPGICRLFPLGRYYESSGFKYFLQVDECRADHRTKVKVKKWIDTPELKKYEVYINDWHHLLMALEAVIDGGADDAVVKKISMTVLELFYLKPYDAAGDFYGQFYERLAQGRQLAESLGNAQ